MKKESLKKCHIYEGAICKEPEDRNCTNCLVIEAMASVDTSDPEEMDRVVRGCLDYYAYLRSLPMDERLAKMGMTISDLQAIADAANKASKRRALKTFTN